MLFSTLSETCCPSVFNRGPIFNFSLRSKISIKTLWILLYIFCQFSFKLFYGILYSASCLILCSFVLHFIVMKFSILYILSTAADPDLVIGGPWERFGEGAPSPTVRGVWGRSPLQIFSLDMLLETYFRVNYAKFTEIGDNFGQTIVKKWGKQYSWYN